MKIKENDKLTLKGVFCFMLFIFLILFKQVPFEILGIDLKSVSSSLIYVYNILIELIIILVIILVFREYITKSFKDYKENRYMYFKKYIKYWFIILISTGACNILISLLNGTIASNEQSVREMLNSYPIYTWILSVLMAPFLEEFIFRLALKNVFKYKWPFIILSGLIFGAFHLIGSTTTLTGLLYIIPYSIPGCIFAYILYDSDNIFTTVFMHMMHNGILVSLEILLTLLGTNII